MVRVASRGGRRYCVGTFSLDFFSSEFPDRKRYSDSYTDPEKSSYPPAGQRTHEQDHVQPEIRCRARARHENSPEIEGTRLERRWHAVSSPLLVILLQFNVDGTVNNFTRREYTAGLTPRIPCAVSMLGSASSLRSSMTSRSSGPRRFSTKQRRWDSTCGC